MCVFVCGCVRVTSTLSSSHVKGYIIENCLSDICSLKSHMKVKCLHTYRLLC